MAVDAVLPTSGTIEPGQFRGGPIRYAPMPFDGKLWVPQVQSVDETGKGSGVSGDVAIRVRKAVINVSEDSGATWAEEANELLVNSGHSLGTSPIDSGDAFYSSSIVRFALSPSEGRIYALVWVAWRTPDVPSAGQYSNVQSYVWRVAYFDCSSGTWNTGISDPPYVSFLNSGTARQTSLRTNAVELIALGSGRLAFLYGETNVSGDYTTSDGRLSYAEYDGSSWSRLTVPNTYHASNPNLWLVSELLLGDSDRVHILYRKTGASSPYEWDLYHVSTTFGSSSFNTDGVAYSEIDIANQFAYNPAFFFNSSLYGDYPVGSSIAYEDGGGNKKIAIPIVRFSATFSSGNPGDWDDAVATLRVLVADDVDNPSFTDYEIDELPWGWAYDTFLFNTSTFQIDQQYDAERNVGGFYASGGTLYLFWLRATALSFDHLAGIGGYFPNSSRQITAGQILRKSFDGSSWGDATLFREINENHGSVDITSVSAQSGGIRTVVTSTPHGFVDGQAISFFLPFGENLTGLNNDELSVISVISETSFTFAESTETAGDGASSGIVRSRSPLDDVLAPAAVWAAGVDAVIWRRVDTSDDDLDMYAIPVEDMSAIKLVYSQGTGEVLSLYSSGSAARYLTVSGASQSLSVYQ